MGQSSEMMIAEHNALMETSVDYREQVGDFEREYYESVLAEIAHEKQSEEEIDWFPDYRLAADGYEEQDECDDDLFF